MVEGTISGFNPCQASERSGHDEGVWSYKDCQYFPSPWTCRCENYSLSLENLNPGYVESIALQTLRIFLRHEETDECQ